MKSTLGRRVFSLLMTLIIVTGNVRGMAQGAATDGVTIQSVDNYAGNSNVTTDCPNTTVVIESLDENGGVVDRWTGTTDANGRITITSTHVLSKPYLRARKASSDKSAVATVEGLVLPNSISDRQSFTFAVEGIVEQAVEVQTVGGNVETRAHTDRLGRVFLETGLAAGTYLVFANGSKKSAGTTQIKPKPQDALARPGQNPPQPLQAQIPSTLNKGLNEHISGTGFSPNANSNELRFAVAEITHGDAREAMQIPIQMFNVKAPVLAATDQEIVTGKMSDIKAGAYGARIVNTESGQASAPAKTTVYSVDLKLLQNRLIRPYTNGTSLLLIGEPKDTLWQVRVLNGPVSFKSGKETLVTNPGGKANIPVIVDKSGNGNFRITARPAWVEREDYDSQFDYLVAKLAELRACKQNDLDHDKKYQDDLKAKIKIVKDALRNHWGERGRKAALNQPIDD